MDNKQRYINHEKYQGVDRRKMDMDDEGFLTGELPPLGTSFKSWLPIFGSVITVIGIAISVGMYLSLVSSTAVLAKDTQCKVEMNEAASIARDKELTFGYNDNKLKIAKHDEALAFIKEQISAMNNKLDRVLTRIEYR